MTLTEWLDAAFSGPCWWVIVVPWLLLPPTVAGLFAALTELRRHEGDS